MSRVYQLYQVDSYTGEVNEVDLETVSIVQRDTLNNYRKRQEADSIKERRAQYAAAKSKNPFVWEIYEISKMRWPDISAPNITRMMYLSTYLCHEGYLATNQHRPMQKSQIQEILGCSERQFYKFWKEMTAAGVFVEKADGIYSDTSKLFKGSLGSPKQIAELADSGQYVMRLYVDGVRQLYEKATDKSLKTLSYVFQILPYVNREFNIVCHNPLETDLKLIKPMTLGEFCETVGYDPKNAYRMSTQLLDPSFMVDGVEQGAVRYVVDKSLDRRTFSIFINPNVYYAGFNSEQIEVLGAFRGAASKKE